MDGGAGNMPRSNPPRKEVLLTKAKIKLNQRGLIVKWADYTPFDGLLGKARPARRWVVHGAALSAAWPAYARTRRVDRCYSPPADAPALSVCPPRSLGGVR